VNFSTFVFKKTKVHNCHFNVSRYNNFGELSTSTLMYIDSLIKSTELFLIPIAVELNVLNVITNISEKLPRWKELENSLDQKLWAGREIDETGKENWLENNIDGLFFVKGGMIDRYKIRNSPCEVVKKKNWNPPSSVNFSRIVWRDVSRFSQQRRMIATIIPAGWIAGNSLGVTYFRDGNEIDLLILLAIMNSFCFEFQLKFYLTTDHVSLSAIRKVSLPLRQNFPKDSEFIKAISLALLGDDESQFFIEAFIAKKIYSVNESEFLTILSSFVKVSNDSKQKIFSIFTELK